MVVEVERIWRIGASPGRAIEVRLAADGGEIPKVMLAQQGAAAGDTQTFDVDVARALAQAMLEACEVASALNEQLAMSS
jgi:hypothetical protein